MPSPVKLVLSVPVQAVFSEGKSEAGLSIKFSDCIATLTDGQGEVLGSVGGTIHGGYEFEDRRIMAPRPWQSIPQTFSVKPDALWNAFQTALVDAGLISEGRFLDVHEDS